MYEDAASDVARLSNQIADIFSSKGGATWSRAKSNVEGVAYDALREGQRVSFTEGRGPKGPRAENVKPE